VQVTREALELCLHAGDDEGIKVYTGNLEAMGTFQVDARDGSGGKYTVVFRNDAGRVLTLDELGAAHGRLEWELRHGPPVAPEALEVHQRGREAGSRGDYEDALSLFTTAAALAPSWPHPIYDRAFTHLLRGDFASALADYRTALELSPGGFFDAAQAVDMLAREETGEFPKGLYATFITHGKALDDSQRKTAAEQIVEKYPGFTPGWEVFARLVEGPGRLDIIDCGLAAVPDPRRRRCCCSTKP
jgi:tetratricopeptide (TPR) repeat protein